MRQSRRGNQQAPRCKDGEDRVESAGNAHDLPAGIGGEDREANDADRCNEKGTSDSILMPHALQRSSPARKQNKRGRED